MIWERIPLSFLALDVGGHSSWLAYELNENGIKGQKYLQAVYYAYSDTLRRKGG